MKRRIVLHLGLSKTGTTSIQMFLSQNRNALAGRGILYPDVSGIGPVDPRLATSVLKPGAGREPNHVALALELNPLLVDRAQQDTGTPLWSAVFRQIEETGSDITIISYENFYLRPEMFSFDLLAEYLRNFEVIGILYLRPLQDWAPSLYSQHVKGTMRLDTAFSRYSLSHHVTIPYSRVIDSIWENIPISSLSVGDLYVASKDDLIQDFLRRSGVAGDAIACDKTAAVTNVSLPSWATLFLLKCNQTHVSDEAFLEIRKILSRSIQRKWGPPLRPGLDIAAPDDRQRLDDIAAADAGRLWARHGVKLTQRTREPIAYRPFDDEDFRSIREAIESRLSPVARAELSRAPNLATTFQEG